MELKRVIVVIIKRNLKNMVEKEIRWVIAVIIKGKKYKYNQSVALHYQTIPIFGIGHCLLRIKKNEKIENIWDLNVNTETCKYVSLVHCIPSVPYSSTLYLN